MSNEPFNISHGSVFQIKFGDDVIEFDIAETQMYIEENVDENQSTKETVHVMQSFLERRSMKPTPTEALNFLRIATMAWTQFKKKFEHESMSSQPTVSTRETTPMSNFDFSNVTSQESEQPESLTPESHNHKSTMSA